MRNLHLIALLTLLACAPVAADYELGLAAYDAGDYETARSEWLAAAEAGHAEAQYRLGRLYYYGRGVESDPAEAARWYRLAAEQGHARSQSNLGFMYQSGSGLPRSDADAAVWFAKAADQGRAVAQYELGKAYETGRGLPRDDSLAAAWYERAARQGLAEAIFDLAQMLESGRGVAQDRKRATKLYRRAAKKGVTRQPGAVPTEGAGPAGADDAAEHVEVPAEAAPAAVGESRAEPADVEPDTTAPAPVSYPAGDSPGATIADAVGPSIAALQSSAARGDAEAQYRLAELNRLGDGVAADPAEAARWYEAAARQGHGLAAYRLAFLYYRGRGAAGRPDFVQAYVWFRRAANAGIGDSEQWVARVEKKLTGREREETERLLRGDTVDEVSE